MGKILDFYMQTLPANKIIAVYGCYHGNYNIKIWKKRTMNYPSSFFGTCELRSKWRSINL